MTVDSLEMTLDHTVTITYQRSVE